MQREKPYEYFYSYSIRWLWLIVLLILFITGCNHPLTEKKQAGFDSLFARLDTAHVHNIKYTEEDMQQLDDAFAAVPKATLSLVAKKYFYKIRYYRGTKRDFSTALLYTDSCLKLLEPKSSNSKLAASYTQALFIKGDIYFAVKNYDEAVRNYTTAKLFLSSGDHAKDSCSFFNYYYSMARALYAQKKYLLAAGFFKLKYKWAACDGNNNPFFTYLTTQENIDNTGLCYQKAGLTDTAFYYFNYALRYIDEHEYKVMGADSSEYNHDRAVVFNNIANLHYTLHDTAAARELYLKSLELGDKRDTGFMWPLQLSLAELYLNSNEWQKAGNILQDLAVSADSTNANSITVKLYRQLADYYIKTSQPLAANKALQRAYALGDTIERNERMFNFIDLRREFENREQQNIAESLKKDNQIKTGYLAIAVGGTILILAVIGMVWYNLNRKSKYVKKLTSLHEEVSSKNQHLQRTLTSLEQSHKENNRIMRVVAHDLKNPINAVRNMVYSLKKDQQQSDKEALELIESTCTESVTLINDLLNNKRSMMDISRELVDMGCLVEQCTELFRVKALEKKQQLKLQTEHPVVLLNRQKIWRVISNIINNAIKFSPEDADINIFLEKKDDHVLISVHDRGIGIPVDLRNKIFTIDPEISRPGTAGEESYGMGLSISRKIIEEHGGHLWFESEAGKGSVFYVQLPYTYSAN